MKTMFGGTVALAADSCAAAETPPNTSANSAALKIAGGDLTIHAANVGFGFGRMSSDVTILPNAGKYTRKETGTIKEAIQKFAPDS